MDVEGDLWMWKKGGCGGRVVDVKGGWWMWRKGGCGGRVVDVKGVWWMWREVTPVLLVLHSLPTHAILYTWATLSTSPTDISLSTGVTLIIAVTLVTGAILFTWATLSMTHTYISLSTGAIGVTLATEALLCPGLRTPFSLLGVLYLLAILELHLLLVLIGQLKLLVLFLLLALVTSFEQKSLCT